MQLTDNLRGAALMMASMAAFTINDTCIKAIGGDMPLFQILTLRGLGAVLLIYALARHLGALRVRLPRRDWVLIGLRSVAEAAAAYFFLTALINMPLANVTAVLQMLPLTLTLCAALVLGERVGWRRMLAILLGFGGMLLIVRPGPDGFDIHAFYVLAAVGCVTVRDLSVRRMSARAPSMLVTLAASVTVLVFAAVLSLTEDWAPISGRSAGLLAGSVLFVFFGYLFSVLVMRAGDVSFTAPFRYTGLLCALLLGWLVFDHWPDPVTLLGAAIVVGSGLFALWREHTVIKTTRPAVRPRP